MIKSCCVSYAGDESHYPPGTYGEGGMFEAILGFLVISFSSCPVFLSVLINLEALRVGFCNYLREGEGPRRWKGNYQLQCECEDEEKETVRAAAASTCLFCL
jgi:hypothetical protein